MRNSITAICVFLAIASTCNAQEAPGEQFTQPLGFALIDTTVDYVQSIFGPAPVTEEGHHESVVCYTWPDSSAIVTFMSQGEGMYGGFTMRRYNKKLASACPSIPKSAIQGKKLMVAGLHLGMSLIEFNNILGKTETVQDGSVRATFEYSTEIDVTKKPQAVGVTLYTTIVIIGHFNKAGLEKLEIFKSSAT